MYILEGNIGAGKSTFLGLIAKHLPEISVLLEPITDWQDSKHGQSLLTSFYENPKRWAYTFETLTMICRAQDHRINQQNTFSISIAERSVYSGYYCFAKNSHAQGFLTNLEWEVYQQWFTFLVAQKCAAPQGFIYLHVSPEISYERLKKRNRSAEQTVPLSYLAQIHEQHEAMLIKKEGILPHLKRVPVLCLDVNEEFETNPAQLARHLDTIKAFLIQTGSLPIPAAEATSFQAR